MKSIILIFSFVGIGFFISCNGNVNNFDASKDPLTGLIDGQKWDYASANGNYYSNTNSIRGMIMVEDTNDPCGIVVTNNPHLTVQFPAQRQTYTLTGAGQGFYVIFNTKNGEKRLTATGGFIQIVSVSTAGAIGYINANFDDNNDVKGAFTLTVCNNY